MRTQTSFLAGDVLTPSGVLSDHALEIRGERISRIVPARSLSSRVKVSRCKGGLLVPGFLDLQVNPVGACDLLTHPGKAVPRLAKILSRAGCTRFLLALITTSPTTLKKQIAQARRWVGKDTGGARLLGLHLEGPFLNPRRLGIHPGQWVQRPTPKAVGAVLEEAGSALRMMTFAPELKGATSLLRRLVACGVLASVGHSDASFSQASLAFRKGAKTATHVFNASRPMHHRDPGIAGAAMAADTVLQIIPDGKHVHPMVVSMVYGAVGKRRMVAVTDALVGGGMAFDFAGQRIRRKQGWVGDGNVLAGSSLAMDEAWRNLKRFTKGKPADLIECLTLTPARLLGLQRRMGTLQAGRAADIVWLDSKDRVKATWVAGKRVYVRHSRISR